MTRRWEHDSMVTLDLMAAAGCDRLYTVITFVRGFALRMFPKACAMEDFVMRPGFDEIVKTESRVLEDCKLNGGKFEYKVIPMPKVEDPNSIFIGNIECVDPMILKLVNMRYALVQYMRLLPESNIPYHDFTIYEAIRAHMKRIVRSRGDPFEAMENEYLISQLRADIINLWNQ